MISQTLRVIQLVCWTNFVPVNLLDCFIERSCERRLSICELELLVRWWTLNVFTILMIAIIIQLNGFRLNILVAVPFRAPFEMATTFVYEQCSMIVITMHRRMMPDHLLCEWCTCITLCLKVWKDPSLFGNFEWKQLSRLSNYPDFFN